MSRLCLVGLLLLATGAFAQGTPRKLLLPDHTSTHNSLLGVPNGLYCWTAPAPASITATKMAILRSSSNAGLTCGVALYPDSDAGPAVAAFAESCGTGLVMRTGLPAFTLTGGTLYRQCLCSTGATGTVGYVSVEQAVTCCQDVTLIQLIQAFTPARIGLAANPCVAGVPPATTGPLTPETFAFGRSARKFPLFLVEE